jgi:hypothetical protein
MEQNGEKLPAISDIKDITVGENEFVQFIACDTIFYKKFYETRTVRTTITLPANLKAIAEREGLNISATAANALREELNMA